VPQAGDILIVAENEKIAREKALEIQTVLKSRRFRSSTMSEIISKIQSGEMKVLKVVLKADTQGSLEAIINALHKIPSEKAKVHVIHSGVGDVSANDINMAAASMAVVMGFHVAVPAPVAKLCEISGIEARTYTIIYQLLDDVTNILEGLLDPEVVEVDLGEAEVLQVFLTTKRDMILGCKVKRGRIENNAMVRVIREEKEEGTGIITNIKRGDKAVKEINEGYECGIRFQGGVKLQEGDMLLAYKKESKKRTL
jgi:translation initiation factor IF-2